MSTTGETDFFFRTRRRLAAGAGRLRDNVWPVAQTALAASLAYFLAAYVIGSEQPFFAPIAAVISLGLTLGQRGRRAIEVVLGVVVGLVVADLLVVILQPPDSGFSPDRILHALIGGGVALAVSHLFPVNPERLVERAARSVFEELAGVLEEVAATLREGGDLERASACSGEPGSWTRG